MDPSFRGCVEGRVPAVVRAEGASLRTKSRQGFSVGSQSQGKVCRPLGQNRRIRCVRLKADSMLLRLRISLYAKWLPKGERMPI
jgi:hypothetical protein